MDTRVSCGVSQIQETLMVLSSSWFFLVDLQLSPYHLSSLDLFIYETKIRFFHTSSDCALVKCLNRVSSQGLYVLQSDPYILNATVSLRRQCLLI